MRWQQPVLRLARLTENQSIGTSARNVPRRQRQKGFVVRAVDTPESSEQSRSGWLSVRDAEILALLIPAIGSVFLDPAMQVVDTGERSCRLHKLIECAVKQ